MEVSWLYVPKVSMKLNMSIQTKEYAATRNELKNGIGREDRKKQKRSRGRGRGRKQTPRVLA